MRLLVTALVYTIAAFIVSACGTPPRPAHATAHNPATTESSLTPEAQTCMSQLDAPPANTLTNDAQHFGDDCFGGGGLVCDLTAGREWEPCDGVTARCVCCDENDAASCMWVMQCPSMIPGTCRPHAPQ